MSYSYTATTKCSLSVDPGWALWSLMEHPLLAEAEACVCQHLPDLYTAPAVREESVGRAGEVSPFLFGRLCLGGQVWLKVILDLFSKSSFNLCFEALIIVIGPLEK